MYQTIYLRSRTQQYQHQRRKERKEKHHHLLLKREVFGIVLCARFKINPTHGPKQNPNVAYVVLKRQWLNWIVSKI